jgi:threonine dehydrogenase-like Zn-dependent dehydrogenase
VSRAFAHVLSEFGSRMRDKMYNKPELTPGQILLRLEVSGVCGSDVHQWQGKDPRVPLPLILGHEGVGRVEAIGGVAFDVNGYRIAEGDRLAFNRGVSCMRCAVCLVHRKPSLCPHRWVYGITRSCQDEPHLFGCYASHVLLTEHVQSVVLPEELPPEVAVAASCSGATCAHCFEEARPEVGDTVVIQGPGPIGAFATAFARMSGAGSVVVVGGTESRLDACRELGATHVLNRNATSPAERLEYVLEITGGLGADIVYEATGDQRAIAEGIKWIRHGGSYVSCGIAEPQGELSLDFFHDIARKHARLQGVWVSDTRHLVQALHVAEQHQELFAKMIDRFPFDRPEDALQAVADRAVTKAVLMHDASEGEPR